MNRILLALSKKLLLAFCAALFICLSANAQMITTYAGNGADANTPVGPIGPGTTFRFIDAMTFDPSGNLYVCTYENRVFKITPAGVISHFAGNGLFSPSGDGGPATSAATGRVTRIIFDAAGNAYMAASATHRIRKVDPSGVITTFAGTGTMGFSGDGGLASAAQIAYPSGVALDAAGTNLYFSDGQQSGAQSGNRIRKIDLTTGIITTIAGTGTSGDTGNGGPATSAQIGTFAITIDGSDNLYLQNVNADGIRKINLNTGIITNYAGTGTTGYSGDGGPALSAQFGSMFDIKADAAGNLYIAEWITNSVIRKIDASGIVSTVAGNGIAGFSGDGSSPTFAQLYNPCAVAISASGTDVYIGDVMNHRIRKVDLLATPVCPNTFSISISYPTNGQATITPAISPNVGTPNYVGTLNGNPVSNPLSTVNINTTGAYTYTFPGNGVYNLNLNYVDTISSIVCLRNVTDTISIINSLTPRAFNRNFDLSATFLCNSGSVSFTDSTTFFYSLSNPSATYTITTNWANGTITTHTVNATNQIITASAPVNYTSPGVYTVQSILSGGGVPNDTTVAFVYVNQCGDLQGYLYNDINNNCTQDWWNSEFPIVQNLPLKATDGTNTYFTWSNGGYYTFANIIAGTYTVEVLTGNSGYVITCANSLPHTTTVTAMTTTYEHYALNCSGGFDIAITGISLYNGLFPGQIDGILPHVGILNGTCDFVIPGQVKMILTPCVQYLAGGALTNAPDYIIPAATGDTLVWNVGDLNQIGNFSYWNYGVLVSTCTTAVVGDTACITMMALPTNGDINPADNIFTQCFMIGVSYDPNYKEVSPAGIGSQGYIPASTNELTYTLHFQNTGTAPAFNVALLDTISTNLDLYSIEILSSSHSVTPYMLPGRTIKFMFANINLPDSTSDEPNSHGYVKYRIKLNAGLTPGTEIKNTCYIYFDYNAPIVTNTTVNTIELLTGIGKNKATDFVVYPNPASDKINIKISGSEISTVVLRDILGNELKKQNTVNGSCEMSLNGLENGVYFISVNQNGKSLMKKIVISR